MKNRVITAPVKLMIFVGAAVGLWILHRKKLKKERKIIKRYADYYAFALQWLRNKDNDTEISKYFEYNKFNKVAVYGVGTLGQQLLDELKKTDIEVLYGIEKMDCDEDDCYDGVNIYSLESLSKRECPDAIIVTPFYDFDNIYDDIMETGMDTEIVSIEEVIYY